jgi:hypothetical protein
MSQREDALNALCGRLFNSWANQQNPDGTTGFKNSLATARRLVHWSAVPHDQQPAFFLIDHEEVAERQTVLAKRTISAMAWVYTWVDLSSATTVGSSLNNAYLDAFEAVLAPSPAEPGRQTLGGLASEVFIEGQLLKDPGDIEGQALLMVPIKLRLP